DDAPPHRGHAGGLDARAAHAQRAALLERARQLAARRAPIVAAAIGAPPAALPMPPASPRWPKQGIGALPDAGKNLLEPCILGPGELCELLAELVTDCDAGDALACMAVGQLLADTPPRPLIASVFFHQACRIGDAAGCEREADLRPPSEVPCARDPFACSWRAYRARDAVLHEQACSLGAGDSCLILADLYKADVARARAYVEAACQSGHPMACRELGLSLSPECRPSEDRPCYPPDAAQARAAFEIACAAGVETGEACAQRR
ncbi:MAG: hypothetical protein M3680_03435, partial [Myxococcota bacterium]|nr:hypothetical protein [Myxococcota bacterium]